MIEKEHERGDDYAALYTTLIQQGSELKRRSNTMSCQNRTYEEADAQMMCAKELESLGKKVAKGSFFSDYGNDTREGPSGCLDLNGLLSLYGIVSSS